MRCDGSSLTSSRASSMALIPIGGGGFEQESLFEDQLVLGILGKGPRIEICRGNRVVIVAGHPTRRDNCRARCLDRSSGSVEPTSE